MMTIIDRRNSNKNKSAGNRKKFIERNKERIKKHIDKSLNGKGITDATKNREIILDDIDEPNFNFDLSTGERDMVLPGNKNMEKGDQVRRSPQDEEEGTGGSDIGDGFDEFAFTLTKEEFLELYFSDLKLPNFIKESLAGTTKHKWKRTGYTKDGIPARLDLVKTLKQAMARRIATQSKRYLDNVDMRYKHFTKQPFPIKQAVMICMMDISASMGEMEKEMAKKFFLLLYLFLNKVYNNNVEVRFISHTQTAKEVSEHEFFYGTESGGTIVSSALTLANNILDTEVDLTSTNVYIAQASDGDNWSQDDEVAVEMLEQLLQKVQYFAYIQTEEEKRQQWKKLYGEKDLYKTYMEVATRYVNLQARMVSDASEIYPTLRSLFEER